MSDIAWPAELELGLVVGRIARQRGHKGIAPARTTVSIVAETNPVQWRGVGGTLVILGAPVPGVIDEDGWLCRTAAYGQPGERGVPLPSTESPDLYPSGWTYRLTIHTPEPQVFRFRVPAGGVVDLATAEAVSQSAGVLRVPDLAAAERAEAAADDIRALLAQITATSQVIVDENGQAVLVKHDGKGAYTVGSSGTIQGLLSDKTLPAATRTQVEGIAAVAVAGRIREVSGTVALPSSGPRVLEFYTTDAATIGGVAFPADTAVVWRRTSAGVWSYAIASGWSA